MADMNLTPLTPVQAGQGVQQAPGVSQGSSSQTQQTPSPPPGTTLSGFIVNRDASGNPILRTENGDVPFTTNFFLKIGSEVVVRFENRAGNTQAHVLSVNGQPPELAEQQSAFDEQPEVIVGNTQEQETPGVQNSGGTVSAPSSAQPGTLNAILLQAVPATEESAAPVSPQAVPLAVRILTVTPQPTVASQPQTMQVPQAAAAYARVSGATPLPQSSSIVTPAATTQASAAAQPPPQTTTPVTAQETSGQPASVAQPVATQIPSAVTQPGQVAAVQNTVISVPEETPIISAAPAIIAPQASAPAPTINTMLVANEVAPIPAQTPAAPIITTATAPAPAVATSQPVQNAPATPAQPVMPQAISTMQTVITQPTAAQVVTTQPTPAPAQSFAATPAQMQSIATPAQSIAANTMVAPAPAAASAPQSSAAPAIAPGQTITATVISNDTNGAVVQTPAGLMRLPAGTGLQPGSSITFEVAQPAPAETATPSALTSQASTPAPLTALARQWGTLQQLVSLVSQHAANSDLPGASAAAVNLPSLVAASAPSVAQAAVSPQAISTGLMFFLTALRGNDFRNWLGASNADWLIDQGHGDLLRRAEAEFTSLSDQYSTTPAGQWRALFFPIAVEGEFQQVRMFTKRDRKQGQGSGQKQQPSEDTRFIVEVTMSQMGELQMDGFVRRQDNKSVQFDLYIRSLNPIHTAAQQDILQIYNNIGQLTGYKGNLLFQAVKEFPVNPMEEVIAHAMKTVVA